MVWLVLRSLLFHWSFTLAEAAKISPYSKDYLNILARRGSIPAFKLKRNWLVSKEALEGYIRSHKKSLTL
jgi:excisionase family DNA binding protein